MSGPIKSVDPSLMNAIRWIENLRVQGHGWSCPKCNEGREHQPHTTPVDSGGKEPAVQRDTEKTPPVVDGSSTDLPAVSEVGCGPCGVGPDEAMKGGAT